ncbi:peroxiredoxin [Anaplasmataceae bacterium AB001_6]|nr:peroxiredoxin [Anaplasmataceae bacterium AB001_6]
MRFIGQEAPDFTSSAVMEDNSIIDSFNLKKHLNGSYGVLFFYPLDFTFVCPTEIMSFSAKVKDFQAINAKIVGISVDSHFSHFAWKNVPLLKGGIEGVDFPLVSDITKNIAREYGVLIDESVALRATVIIDPSFKIRVYHVNDLPIGRNIDEYIRLVKAIQHNEQYGEVCPANWNGGKAMNPTNDGVKEYMNSI